MPLILLDEAAALLGISSEELAEARSRGDIFGYRDGSSWKFKESEIDRFKSTIDISSLAGSGSLPSTAPIDDDLDELVAPVAAKDDDSPDSLLVSEQELGESDPAGGSTIIGKDELADDLKAADSEINLLGDDDELKLESDIKLEEPGETLAGSGELSLSADDSEIKLADDKAVDKLDAGSELSLDSGSELSLDAGSELSLDDGSELTLEGSGDELKLEGSGLSLDDGSELSLEGSGDLTLDGSEISLEDSGSLSVAPSGSGLLSNDDLLAASSGNLDDADDDLILDEGGLSGDELSLDLDGDDEINLDGSGIDLDASGTGINLLDASSSDITLDASSSGINLNPSDSGISLEASGDDLGSGVEALELGEADDEIIDLGGEDVDFEDATEMGPGDDFLLSPVDGSMDDEESGSQVIALDAEEEVDFEDATMLGDGDLGGGLEEVADFEAMDDAESFDMVDAAGPTAIGATAAAAAATAGAATAGGGALPEAPFSIWNVLFLGLSVLLLSMCGIMVMDLLRNMWSWQEPYSLTSTLMDGILGLMGK